jgi:hypothetical protein
MIEIEKRNGKWEASFACGLIDYADTLQDLFGTLNARGKEIEEEVEDFIKDNES